MKKIYLYLAVISSLQIFTACEEVGPYINMSPPKSIDTTYISTTPETPQTKLILIEDFTGVRCPNCPKAAQKAEDLKELYPGRILSAAIHFETTFGIPHGGSKYDFRLIPEGKQIFEMLPGMHSALPIGNVDRTRHTDGSGNYSVLQLYSTWSTYVSEQLLKNTPVNVYIDPVIKDTLLSIKIRLHYTQMLTDTHAITIYVVEDSIIDLQTLPTTAIDSYYVHNHIVRKVVTAYNGDDLKASLVVNRVFEKEYRIKLDPQWKRSNCSVMAFVQRKGYYYDVIQVQQKHLP